MLPWRGDGEIMRGVDLCGFSDSEGRDTGFIEEMVAYLREEVRQVNCFLLLLNSQEPRIGMHLKDMLVALKNVFGEAFMRHVLVGFTRWDYSVRGAILRRGVTRETLSNNVNGVLRELVGHAHECPCVFLDNTVNMCTDEELRALYTCRSCGNCGEELAEVTSAFEEALETIRRAAAANEPFQCAHIESTLAERDIGRDSLEREAAAFDEGREALERLTSGWEELSIDEPSSLEARLEAELQASREALHHFLAARCKPDLEHVMASVLETFDARSKEEAQGVIFKNRTAAASSNRSLRMALIREYKACIDEQVEASGSATPRQRFDEIHAKFEELVLRFAGTCKGGSLAWQPLVVLQDQLRMEQVDAREKILSDDLKKGVLLPSLSPPVKDAKVLLGLFGSRPVPAWVLAASSQVESGAGSARPPTG